MRIESTTTEPTPVHSMTTSGSKPNSGMARSGRWPRGRNELRLGALRDLVQHMDVEPVLDADEGGEHADRAGTGDQNLPRFPERPRSHGPDKFPGFGHTPPAGLWGRMTGDCHSRHEYLRIRWMHR